MYCINGNSYRIMMRRTWKKQKMRTDRRGNTKEKRELTGQGDKVRNLIFIEGKKEG